MNKKSSPIILGIISAVFFALTFVLNRLMSVSGGSWMWSSAFRFVFMAPVLTGIVLFRRNFSALISEMKAQLGQWILWSTIGFGLFYAPLTFAAAFGPSWLVAGTWQVTIIAGMLIAPILDKKEKSVLGSKIDYSTFLFSVIILAGVVMMQVSQAKVIAAKQVILGTIPVIIAAFAYPLGNRKMMQITKGKLDAYQRTLGMTLASLPFWAVILTIGAFTQPAPKETQLLQCLIVAIVSGVIATTLFFKATDQAKNKPHLLASVEATQAGEVIFALVGEIVILHSPLPDLYSVIGVALVIIGMILHSLKSA